MNAPMAKFMKVGLIHFMAYPDTIKGTGDNILPTLKKIATDFYFQAIEISWIKDAATRAAAKKMLDTSALTVAYGGQPRMLTTGMNINAINEEERLSALSSLKEGIDEAYEMGAVGFAFLSGKYEESKEEEAYQALLTSVRAMCDYAKQKGDIPVLLEVFDYDMDKKSIIGPVERAKRFAEDMASTHDNFGLLVDLSHLPLLHESARESLVPIKQYIKHAHIGNAVIEPGAEAFGDMHPRFGFPKGENNVEELTEFLKVLFEIGYLGGDKPKIVSFEVKPWGDEDPDVVVANAKRTLDMAWAKLEI